MNKGDQGQMTAAMLQANQQSGRLGAFPVPGQDIPPDPPRAKRSIHGIGDRLVLRRVEVESYSAGGIIIPDTVAKPTWEAEVIAVDPSRGKVEVGDHVLIPPGAPEVDIDGERYVLVKEDAVLCVLRTQMEES